MSQAERQKALELKETLPQAPRRLIERAVEEFARGAPVALAEQLKAVFITSDDPLARAVRKRFPAWEVNL